MEITDSKLILLIKTFNKAEFEKFEKFINSPYFNTSEQLSGLVKLLKTDYPGFKKLSKNDIFNHFYPKQEYKDKKVRDLLSRLLELAEVFIAQLEFEKEHTTRNFSIMNQHIERGLDRHFKSKFREYEKYINSENVIDENYLYTKFSLAKLYRNYTDIFSNVAYEDSFSEIIYTEYESFLNFIIYNILNYTLVFSIRKYAVNNDIHLEFSEKVLEFLEKHPSDKYPVINIFNMILNIQKTESEPVSEEDVRRYNILIEYLNKNFQSINKEIVRTLFIYLVNYTRLKSLANNRFFKDEHYRLLKYSIENDLYPKEGKYFGEASYVIVASTALINKDFEWAEDFIEKFKNELKPEVKENAYTMCMANLNYRKGNYEKALKLLVRVSIEDIYYQLKVKNLQIKIHYELGDYEMCKSVIDSFRHFLSSSKQFPEFVRIRFVNYVNFTSRMVNIWLGGDTRNLIEILRELNELPQERVESKSWLLAQASKIKI